MAAPFPHVSVLLNEVIEAFAPVRLLTFIDGTVGAGGHAQALLENHPEIEHYIAIDQDPDALIIAAERLKTWGDKVSFNRGNFSEFPAILKKYNIDKVDGMLVDLGVSSMQIDRAERGFSFSQEGPLDMRMDPSNPLTAAAIVNTWSESDLGRVFRDYGEEKQWRNAARAIVAGRLQKPIETTSELAAILNTVLYRNKKKGINPLTLIFQALRIATNRELEQLETFLEVAVDSLNPKGRLAAISFHSLEDRLVKERFRFLASDKWETTGLGGIFRDKEPVIVPITRKPIVPDEPELLANPRSRSAKLRVAEKK